MFKNMKIGKRLIVSFVMIAILASIAGVVGLFVTSTLDKDYGEALIYNGFSQGDIGKFNTYLNKGGAVVRDIIFLTSEAEREAAQKELVTIKAQTLDSLAELKKTCSTPEELALIAIIDEALPIYQQKRDEVVALGLANKNEEALNVFRNEARPQLNKCMTAAEELTALNVEMGHVVSNQLTAQSRVSMLLIMVVIVVALVLSILLGIFISRSISRPIKECSDRLDLLSKGDLHSPVPAAKSRDEAGMMLNAMKVTTETIQEIIGDIDSGLGELARGNLKFDSTVDFRGDFITIKTSIDMIVNSLNITMGQINQAADQVSSGSGQVSGGAQALSQGATEQASSIEELAATINEISEQVKRNAANAANASKQVGEVGVEMIHCNKQMQEMTGAMLDISEKSSEIGKIIKTIEDIAFQTNILALNAAVEAARAGAAGKGFAVVADEVRNLASKSADAAKNTTALIESSISAVQRGTGLTDATADSLQRIVVGAKEVTEVINQIATASDEQANAITQVTQGVDQISSVVQTNSATAEESAAASEELSSQAEVLKDLVGKFKLKSDSVHASRAESVAADHTVSFQSAGKY